ncbi:MAG: acetolactate synthase [Oscillospiraceae bacterium]|nr:acetolactate synthase [Oscillospiraceae bacterium]
MFIEQISVFIENRPGRLAETLTFLAARGQDIRAFSVAEKADFGILRMIVHNPDAAVAALKEKGFTAKKTEVLGILIGNAPGSSVKAIQVLSDAGINIEYTYAFVTPQAGGAFVLLRVQDNVRAAEILRQAGVALVGHKDIF